MVTLDLELPTSEATTENETAEQAAELLEMETDDVPLDTNCPTNETKSTDPDTKSTDPDTFAPGVQDTNTPESDVKEPQQQPEMDILGDPLPPTDQQIAKAKAESDFRERIERLSKNVVDAAIEWTTAKDRAKLTKKFFDGAIEILTDATDEGPCYMPLFDRASSSSELATEVSTDPPPPPEPQFDADEWRKPSINEIGLKPKLAETLLEAGIETIGMLEDLRADISQGRKKWPKGIGAAKITTIEDAVINWLTKHRDRTAIAGAADEGEQAHDALMARAADLDDGNFESKHSDGKAFWASGFEASQRGLELRECPYVAGAEQDDWIRGWFRNENTFMKPESTTAEVNIDDL